MIYLLKSNDKLKIGYTKNFNRRLKQYRTHNIDIEVVATKEGTTTDEQFLHNILKPYKVDLEWFYYDPYIIDTFNKHKEIQILNLEEM